MNPKLQFSCSENWEDMRVGMIGRLCFKCDKVVVDFTGSTREELVQHLLQNKGQSVCGRVRPDQIDAYHAFVEVCIWKSLRTKRSSNLAFYLIAVGGFALSGCGQSEEPTQPDRSSTSLDSSMQSAKPDADTTDDLNQQSRDEANTKVVIDDIPLVGELGIDDTVTQHGIGAHSLPEVMPEYPGGQDSLYTFMRNHLTYPEWESTNKIEGKVYVEFFIDERGAVMAPNIKRTVQGAKNLDDEVLRVIRLMPPWSPGRIGDKPVATHMVLPVSFKL